MQDHDWLMTMAGHYACRKCGTRVWISGEVMAELESRDISLATWLNREPCPAPDQSEDDKIILINLDKPTTNDGTGDDWR